MRVSSQRPDHRQPAIYADVSTSFQWFAPGLLLPEQPCNFIAHFYSAEAFYPEHRGLLSIKYAFSGEEFYEVGRDRIAVDSGSYLVLNDGQPYASRIRSQTPVESFAVFFDPDFAADVLRSLVIDADRLLDTPHATPLPVSFFQQRYDADHLLIPLLHQIRDAVRKGWSSHGWLEEQFHSLLQKLMAVHRNVRAEIDSMAGMRLSLRVELYQRLHRARDYMNSNLSEPLTIPRIADSAFLSPHYFLRTFRRVFHETPHQYLTRQRLVKAQHLLARTDHNVLEICYAVGFESIGSFTTLFHRHVGLSPIAYRHRHRP